MADLEERLKSIDSVGVPDQWEGIRSGTPRHSDSGEPPLRTRVLVGALALVVAGGGVVLVTKAFGRGPSSPSPLSSASGHGVARSIEVTATTGDGSVRCTATLPSSVVQPGRMTGISFTLTNLGNRPFHYANGFRTGHIDVLDSSGSLLWSSSMELSQQYGPGPQQPRTLGPGQSVGLPTADTVIRWRGKLTINPICAAGVAIQLPPVTVRVAVPGATPSAADSIGRAVERTGGLFDHCVPPDDGSWVDGRIEPPGRGQGVPDMDVRCSAAVDLFPGFAVVELRFVSPSDVPEPTFSEQLGEKDLPDVPSVEIGRWRFVVTADGVWEAAQLQFAARTNASKVEAPYFDYEDGVWSGGSVGCGGTAFGGGIAFISACPS